MEAHQATAARVSRIQHIQRSLLNSSTGPYLGPLLHQLARGLAEKSLWAVAPGGGGNFVLFTGLVFKRKLE